MVTLLSRSTYLLFSHNVIRKNPLPGYHSKIVLTSNVYIIYVNGSPLRRAEIIASCSWVCVCVCKYSFLNHMVDLQPVCAAPPPSIHSACITPSSNNPKSTQISSNSGGRTCVRAPRSDTAKLNGFGGGLGKPRGVLSKTSVMHAQCMLSCLSFSSFSFDFIDLGSS